jgi:hypothetical protein
MVDDISGSPPPGTGRERVVFAAAAALQGLALAVLVLPAAAPGGPSPDRRRLPAPERSW